MTGDLTDAFRQVFGEPAFTLPRDPGSYEDYADQRPGLSKRGRREQRRPSADRVDEYGYDQRGRYHADLDGAA